MILLSNFISHRPLGCPVEKKRAVVQCSVYSILGSVIPFSSNWEELAESKQRAGLREALYFL